MSDEQPAQDPSAPGAPVKRGNLITRNMTGIPTHPTTGRHRVVNSCRSGHHEVIEVHTQADLIEAMIAACHHVMPDGRACKALVNLSRHVAPDGREIGMILILDEKTPPGDPEAAR
jgi:hypothetical protein